MELMEEILRGVVGEAHITAEELLVQNGSVQETRHLLFFDQFARESQDVAASGEDETGDLAVAGGEKGKFAFFEIELDAATAEFDAIGGNNLIGGGRIEAESVQSVVELVRRLIGRRTDCRCNQAGQNRKCHPGPHTGSVVTFGIAEQGR